METFSQTQIMESIILQKDFSKRYIQEFMTFVTKIKSFVYFESDDKRIINAKSIIGLLSLNYKKGDKFNIIVANFFSYDELLTDIEKILNFFEKAD